MQQNSKILYNQIDEILWKDWDPIYLNNMTSYRYEYQNYTPHIFNLKIQGADKLKIADCLFDMETIDMGLHGNWKRCKHIAEIIFYL